MIRYITILSFFLFSNLINAHQVDLSTVVLVEKENNTWILQVRAPLTAFQQEIKIHYAKTPYKSPEEFKEMVLAHLRKNISLVFNGNQSLLLKKGFVKLGHETNVVFEVDTIPEEINDLVVKNTSFQSIYKSKSALVILKEGFSKKKFVINSDNNYSLELKTEGNQFIEKSINKNKTEVKLNAFFILFFVFVIVSIVLYKKQKRELILG